MQDAAGNKVYQNGVSLFWHHYTITAALEGNKSLHRWQIEKLKRTVIFTDKITAAANEMWWLGGQPFKNCLWPWEGQWKAICIWNQVRPWTGPPRRLKPNSSKSKCPSVTPWWPRGTVTTMGTKFQWVQTSVAPLLLPRQPIIDSASLREGTKEASFMCVFVGLCMCV